jgi:hypothetical protein
MSQKTPENKEKLEVEALGGRVNNASENLRERNLEVRSLGFLADKMFMSLK